MIIYVVTVVFCVAAAIFLIAPVPLHRRMFARGRKSEVVKVSANQAKSGISLLGVAIVGATLLALDVPLPRWVAVVIAGGIAVMLLTVWYVIPTRRVRRPAEPDPPPRPSTPERVRSARMVVKEF